jgi:hypothetical protein
MQFEPKSVNKLPLATLGVPEYSPRKSSQSNKSTPQNKQNHAEQGSKINTSGEKRRFDAMTFRENPQPERAQDGSQKKRVPQGTVWCIINSLFFRSLARARNE